MNNINLNGMQLSGKSVIITDGKILIDGKDVTANGREVNITVQGNLTNLQVDICSKVTVEGDCGLIETKSGNVEIKGNVNGSVKTMSGNIKCGNVEGNASTMSGNIYKENN